MYLPMKHKIVALVLVSGCLLASPAASAHVDIGLNIGVPGPVYAEPSYVTPVYAGPSYIAPVGPGYYRGRHYSHGGRRDFHHHR